MKSRRSKKLHDIVAYTFWLYTFLLAGYGLVSVVEDIIELFAGHKDRKAS